MVGTLVDHMIALVVTGVILVSAIAAVPTLSYVNLFYVDQQQLRNVALDTLKTILLDAGYPVKWGSNYDFDPDQVERFGLAPAGSYSSYVLDRDKVQRLVVGNPTGFIGYEDIRAKLKLQGYGFTFKIVPPFRVIVNDADYDGEMDPLTLDDLVEGIEVSVTNNAGLPVPKASVEATSVYVLKGYDNFYIVKASNSTDAVGNCKIKPDIPEDPKDLSGLIVVFRVTVADLTTVTSSHLASLDQSAINASIVGDEVTLAIPEGPGWEKDSSGARWVDSVVLVTEDEVWNMYGGTKSNEDKITWGGGSWDWSMRFTGLDYYDPLFAVFRLNVPNPRRAILCLGPEASSKGLTVVTTGDPTEASPIQKLQRCVIISGMTYIAELTLWKESP